MNDLKSYIKFQYKLLRPVLGGSFFITTLLPFVVLITAIFILKGINNNTFEIINALFFIMNALYLSVTITVTHKSYIKASMFFRITRKKYYFSIILYVILMAVIAALIQSIVLIAGNILLGTMKNITIINVLGYFIISCLGFALIQLILNLVMLLSHKIGMKSCALMILIFAILGKFKVHTLIMNFLFVHKYYVGILTLLIIVSAFSYISWLFIRKLEITF